MRQYPEVKRFYARSGHGSPRNFGGESKGKTRARCLAGASQSFYEVGMPNRDLYKVNYCFKTVIFPGRSIKP